MENDLHESLSGEVEGLMSAGKVGQARRAIIEELKGAPDAGHLADTLIAAGRLTYEIDPQRDRSFEDELLWLATEDFLFLVFNVAHLLREGIETGTLSSASLEHGEAVQAFLSEEGRIRALVV